MPAIQENFNYGTGRRKTSSARVYLKPGKGNVTINNKTLEEYFGRKTARIRAMRPLQVAGISNMDVFVKVSGGGNTGQSGAIALGIARALIEYDSTVRPPLKKAKMLTRDSRKVERKKYGLKKARKDEQYSKR